jgi:hypothetical protein
MLLAAPASAALDLSCMVSAVEKRDNAIIAAWDTFSTTHKTALETRRDALKTAWADSNKATRRAAVRNAWRTFRNSKKNAWRTRKSAIRSAWRTFNAERKACGAQAADESGTQATDLTID